MAYGRISKQEAREIADLSSRLGSIEFRTLMSDTGGTTRLMRPERLSHLASGRGRISQAELERLDSISANSALLKKLSQKDPQEKRRSRVRHAMRDWLVAGKEKGEYQPDKEREQKAIRAFHYLGIDPSEGTYYVRKRKK